MKAYSLFVTCGLGLLLAGCSTTGKRVAVDAMAAGAGAGVGSAVGKNPGYAIGGAVVGTAIAEVAQGRNEGDYQQGVNDGYDQAVSDEAKRKYWQQQNANANPGPGGAKGRTVYYVFDESNKKTPDGRQTPEKTEVAVPVYEPLPVK